LVSYTININNFHWKKSW